MEGRGFFIPNFYSFFIGLLEFFFTILFHIGKLNLSKTTLSAVLGVENVTVNGDMSVPRMHWTAGNGLSGGDIFLGMSLRLYGQR